MTKPHRADRHSVSIPRHGLLGRVVKLAGGAIGASPRPHEERAARLSGPNGVVGADLGKGRMVELTCLGPVALPGALVEGAENLTRPDGE